MDKRIIEYGWDVPDPHYVREHIREMERLPFDGFVLRIDLKRPGAEPEGYGFTAIRREAWQRDWFRPYVEDLRATEFRTMTDNFVLAWACPGTADWFNDEHWRAACANIRILAWVAREGRLKGIAFDPEPYGGHNPWRYTDQPDAKRHPFDKYRAQVRKRGAEFMRAMAAEYPGITFLMFFGASDVAGGLLQTDPVSGLATVRYGLLPFFIDGMLDAIPDGSFIVDGCENGYYMEDRAAFLEAYYQMRQRVLPLMSPENRRKYCTNVLAGFGLYPDRNWRDPQWGWHVGDPEKNYYPPAKFQENLANAVEIADRYVWVYTEASNWYTGKGLPRGYEDAVREVHDRPMRLRLATLIAKRQVPAEQLITYLPTEWGFRKDDADRGTGEGWYKPEYDDSAWGTVSTERQWFEQESFRNMTGRGWARVWFDVPAAAAGKRIQLFIGALDERGDLYVNGTLVYRRRPTDYDGWQLPFAVDVTDVMRPGARNLLAVDAVADTTLGGVWRPCALVTGLFTPTYR